MNSNLDPLINIDTGTIVETETNNIMSEKTIYEKTYSSNLKKKIAIRVENLKSKKHFKEVFRIIHSKSSNSYTKDSSGVYINFNILDNETLKAVEEYLNIINPIVEVIPLPSKYTPYFFENYTAKDSGIKLSNHEKNILKYMDSESESKNILNDSDTKTSETNKKVNIIIKPFSYE